MSPTFLLDPAVAFLNHGSFGATPLQVLEAQREWQVVMERQPMDFFDRRLEQRLLDTLSVVAPYVGARMDDLVFVSNATTAANAVFQSLDLAPGDEVVATSHGYLALANALALSTRRAGARMRVAQVPFPLRDHDELVAAVEAELSPKTRLLVVDAIASPTALRFPEERLVALAKARGVPVFVDGAHAPGQIPVELSRLEPDYWTGNLHKWMMAAKGCALLWVHPRHQARLRPAIASNHHGLGFHKDFHWQGTQDPSAWLSSEVAVRLWESAGGLEARSEHHDLARRARSALAHALGTALPHPDDPSYYACMASVRLPAPPERKLELARRLVDEHQVQAMFPIWADQLWCRVSISHYNRWSDLERLIEGLRALGVAA